MMMVFQSTRPSERVQGSSALTSVLLTSLAHQAFFLRVRAFVLRVRPLARIDVLSAGVSPQASTIKNLLPSLCPCFFLKRRMDPSLRRTPGIGFVPFVSSSRVSH